MYKVKINSVLLILILLSCSEKTDYPEDKFTYNLNIDVKHNNLMASSFFTEIDFVLLESDSSSLIGNIDKIIYYKSRFYILDRDNSKSVFVFDTEGRFIYKIDRLGQGPGEFDIPHDFIIDEKNNQLIILDPNLKKVIYYSLDGKFIAEKTIDFNAFFFQKTSNVRYCFSTGNISDYNSTNSKLIITDSSFNDIEGHFPIGDLNYLAVFPHTVFTKQDSILYYMPILDHRIFKIVGSDIIPYMSINFGQNTFNASELNTSDPPHVKIQNIVSGEYATNISNFTEIKQWMYFGFSYSGTYYMVVYNKENGELQFGDILMNDINMLPMSNIFWQMEDKVVSVIEAYILQEYIANVKSQNLNISIPPELKNIDSFSNPILMIANLKSVNYGSEKE